MSLLHCWLNCAALVQPAAVSNLPVRDALSPRFEPSRPPNTAAEPADV